MEGEKELTLARALMGLVWGGLVCVGALALLVPLGAVCLELGEPEELRQTLVALAEEGSLLSLGEAALRAWRAVWRPAGRVLRALFYWLCCGCAAAVLWQARSILNTILARRPFQRANARAMARAAAACWVLCGGALVRFLGYWWERGGPAAFFTYNTLLIPLCFMAGLLFWVMSALFRQAADLKEDQDLTI